MVSSKFKSLAAVSMLLVAPSVFAMDLFRKPYLGVEVIQTNQNYDANFGQHALKTNPQDYSVYGGFRFCRWLGVEGGYEFQPKRSKTVVLTQGQSIPGGPIIPAGGFDTANTSIKGTHPYLGLFAEYDMKCSWFCCLQWQALVGASFSNIKATTQVTAVDGAPINGFLFTYDQSKVVVLAKISATIFFTPRIGLRISGDYRNLDQFNIPANAPPERLKVKDTWGVGVGLTYSFCKC